MVPPAPTGPPSAGLLALAAAAAVTAGACALLLYAGMLERRGLLPASRKLARRAGLFMAAGTLLEIPAAAILLITIGAPARNALLGDDRAATALAAVAAAAAVAAGASGLLAGLSGKPRPTGWLAAVLLIASISASLLAALRL